MCSDGTATPARPGCASKRILARATEPFKTIFILVELLNLAAGVADIADGRGETEVPHETSDYFRIRGFCRVRCHSITCAYGVSVIPVTMSLQELQSVVDVKKLPAEDFEDQSLVDSTRR